MNQQQIKAIIEERIKSLRESVSNWELEYKNSNSPYDKNMMTLQKGALCEAEYILARIEFPC